MSIRVCTTPIAPAPKWLTEFVTSKTKTSTAVSTRTSTIETLATAAGAGEGQRHATALELIGREIGFGTSKPEVLRLALAWGRRCSPPKDDSEIERIVKDLSARHANKPTAELSRILADGKPETYQATTADFTKAQEPPVADPGGEDLALGGGQRQVAG